MNIQSFGLDRRSATSPDSDEVAVFLCGKRDLPDRITVFCRQDRGGNVFSPVLI